MLNIPLTYQEIADMVVASRQTITSSLSALHRQGLLGKHRICLKSPELLGELTQGTPGAPSGAQRGA